jgi:hypothetical protein
LVINVPGTGRSIPFEQLRESASKVLSAERKIFGGKEMVIVRLGFNRSEDRPEPWELEIVFDPAVNYLVRRVVHSSGSRFRRVEEVVQFKNCGGGVFFPEHIIGGVGADDNYEDGKSDAILSDIRVNAPLSADAFRIRYPNGIYMTDSITGTSYRIDSDGKRISSEKPLGKNPPPPPSALAGPDEGVETTEEPKPLSRWLVPISVGFIAVALLLIVRRRWRASSQ